MALHVIVGKGPVGTTTAAELLADAGHEVRVLSRSGGPSTEAVEHRQVDATDADALAAAAARARRRSTTPSTRAYHRWATDWPPVAAALLAAAERTGARPRDHGRTSTATAARRGPMTPDSPLAATDVKGRVRARMWADALAAHEAGRVRVTEARAADFVGPQVPADAVPPEPPARDRCAGAGAPGSSATPTPRAAGRTCPTSPRPWRPWAPTSGRSGRAWHVPSNAAAVAAAGARRPRRGDGRAAGPGERHPVAGAAGGRARRPA